MSTPDVALDSRAPSKGARAGLFLLQLVVAGILLQTLFFKFTGAAESVWIFTQLGAEPWGRWASGLAELLASALLFVPGKRVFGALLALGVMAGAIVSHLTVLGIEVQGDGGLLFALACTVLASSAVLAWASRHELPRLSR